MNKIQQIYNLLLNNFKPQGWWPVTVKGEFTPKYYQTNHNNKQKFEIIIGAILTQNTNWKNVEKAIKNLNKANILDIKKIQKIDLKRLSKLIQPAGYYNQKADYIKNIADHLKKQYKSELKQFFKKPLEKLRQELLDIKGIGPETADSIILYSANKPIFVIDAYTKRIFNRIGYQQSSYQDFQNLFMNNLEKNTNLFQQYHALIVELAKKHCKKEPECKECPINSLCNNHNTNSKLIKQENIIYM